MPPGPENPCPPAVGPDPEPVPPQRCVSVLVIVDPELSATALTELDRLAGKRGWQAERVGDGSPAVVRVQGAAETMDAQLLSAIAGVVSVVDARPAVALAARTAQRTRTEVSVGRAVFGGSAIQIVAGPCAVRSAAQIEEVCSRLAALGLRAVRAGVFKPRTSPYAFQGLGLEGLAMLGDAARRHGLAVLTEVMAPDMVERVGEHADMLQVGARSMSNYPLLRAVGRSRRPVMLKRAVSASYDELLGAAEYILSEGNPNVVLCERGIRTFVSEVRETLDVSAVPVLKRKTHLPVIVDPSHAAGARDLVAPLTLAALAAGADGAMIEVDVDPEQSPSDGAQLLWFDQLEDLLGRCRALAKAIGRELVP